MERSFGAGLPGRPAAVEARLASLEDEARRLRAEIAALQDDIRWLTGEDEPEPGWLARGWTRASLLLATVGVVAIVSLPYLLHSDPAGLDPGGASAAHAAPAPPRSAGPAVTATMAREIVARPGPGRAAGPREPVRLVSEERPAASRPRAVRPAAATEAVLVTVPARDDNSP